MKKLQRWAIQDTQYLYDVNAMEAYTLGAKRLREEVYQLIKLADEINAENIKSDPTLASFLLLELADRVKTLGEENE